MSDLESENYKNDSMTLCIVGKYVYQEEIN